QIRIALEQAPARELPVAVQRDQWLGPGRQMVVLVLKRMRELVAHQHLADDVATGEDAKEPGGEPARLEAVRAERERLGAWIVERRDLLFQERRHGDAERRGRRQQAERLIDRGETLEIAGAVGRLDLVGDEGAHGLVVEHARRDRLEEAEAAHRDETALDVAQDSLLHHAVAGDPGRATSGPPDRRQARERAGGGRHGSGSSKGTAVTGADPSEGTAAQVLTGAIPRRGLSDSRGG